MNMSGAKIIPVEEVLRLLLSRSSDSDIESEVPVKEILIIGVDELHQGEIPNMERVANTSDDCGDIPPRGDEPKALCFE